MVQYPSRMNNTNIIYNIDIKSIENKGLDANIKYTTSKMKKLFTQQSEGKKAFLYIERWLQKEKGGMSLVITELNPSQNLIDKNYNKGDRKKAFL